MDTPIRIAAVLPLSGAEQLFGSQGLQGAQMAVAELNAAGGVRGRRLELQVLDERTDTATAVSATERAIEEGAVAVLGPTSSTDRNAMLEVCRAAGVPLLYGTDYEGGQCSRYLFCYSPIPEHYVDPLVPHLMGLAGGDFVIIGADYVWPTSIGAAFRQRVEAAGGSVLSETYLPPDTGDFTDQVAAIHASGASNVVMMLLGTDGQQFIRQFAAAGINATLTVMAFNENYMVGLDQHEVEGIVTCAPFLASLDRPETTSFVDRQRAMFGADAVVSYFAESHYGLVRFLAGAIERAGSAEPAAFIDAMGDQTMTFGNGPVTLRASDHHMVLNMVIAQVRDGRLAMTEYVGPVAPSDQCGGRGAS